MATSAALTPSQVYASDETSIPILLDGLNRLIAHEKPDPVAILPITKRLSYKAMTVDNVRIMFRLGATPIFGKVITTFDFKLFDSDDFVQEVLNGAVWCCQKMAAFGVGARYEIMRWGLFERLWKMAQRRPSLIRHHANQVISLFDSRYFTVGFDLEKAVNNQLFGDVIITNGKTGAQFYAHRPLLLVRCVEFAKMIQCGGVGYLDTIFLSEQFNFSDFAVVHFLQFCYTGALSFSENEIILAEGEQGAQVPPEKLLISGGIRTMSKWLPNVLRTELEQLLSRAMFVVTKTNLADIALDDEKANTMIEKASNQLEKDLKQCLEPNFHHDIWLVVRKEMCQSEEEVSEDIRPEILYDHKQRPQLACHQLHGLLGANHFMLAFRSDYFRMFFASGFCDTGSSVIHIQQFCAETMNCVLKYIYCGEYSDLSINEQNAVEVMLAADMYMLAPLKRACETFIAKKICEENFDILKQVAEDYNAPQLNKELDNYRIRKANRQAISESEEMKPEVKSEKQELLKAKPEVQRQELPKAKGVALHQQYKPQKKKKKHKK